MLTAARVELGELKKMHWEDSDLYEALAGDPGDGVYQEESVSREATRDELDKDVPHGRGTMLIELMKAKGC